MPRKTGLGKGLGALIPSATAWKDEREATAPAPVGVAELPVNSITPNPHQPRTVMDEAALQELANSCRPDPDV